MKTEIEGRIVRVTGYTGQMDLPALLANSMRECELGLSPDWMVARACMTPDEYTAWGRDGSPWRFMRGNREVAERAIGAARRVVSKHAKKMSLDCVWEALAR